MTLSSNPNVAPFSMFGDGLIPLEDISKYGTPIAINGIQASSAPCPAGFRWRDDWQKMAVSCMC